MESKEKQLSSSDEAQIVAYLLGTLPEAESDNFEQRYLADASLFTRLQEIEDELIDDYSNGMLTEEERHRFEQNFLRSPVRREKVNFALAMAERAGNWKKEELRAVVSSKETGPQGQVLSLRWWQRPVPAWRQWGAIAAAVLIAITAATLWLRNRELHRALLSANTEEVRLREQVRSNNERAEQAETRVTEQTTQIQSLTEQLRMFREQTQAVRNVVVSAFLGLDYLTHITRSRPIGKVKPLKLTSNTSEIHLNLEFDQRDFQNFTAALFAEQDLYGTPRWSGPRDIKAINSGPARQKITLTIPAKGLSGDFQLVINASESKAEIARYRLKITRAQ